MSETNINDVETINVKFNVKKVPFIVPVEILPVLVNKSQNIFILAGNWFEEVAKTSSTCRDVIQLCSFGATFYLRPFVENWQNCNNVPLITYKSPR